MPDTQSLITYESLATFAGATGATFAVTNSLQRVAGVSPAWLGLVVAQAISLGILWRSGTFQLDWLIGLINGCMIYLSAAGATSAAAAAAQPALSREPAAKALPGQRAARAQKPEKAKERQFLSPWF